MVQPEEGCWDPSWSMPSSITIDKTLGRWKYLKLYGDEIYF